MQVVVYGGDLEFPQRMEVTPSQLIELVEFIRPLDAYIEVSDNDIFPKIDLEKFVKNLYPTDVEFPMNRIVNPFIKGLIYLGRWVKIEDTYAPWKALIDRVENVDDGEPEEIKPLNIIRYPMGEFLEYLGTKRLDFRGKDYLYYVRDNGNLYRAKLKDRVIVWDVKYNEILYLLWKR